MIAAAAAMNVPERGTVCGIAGVIDLAGGREPDRAALGRMTERLHHRGPDDDGFLALPGIAMGQRRLAIVGIDDGRQPMWNEDRTVAVMFNGEIFDHVERRAELEGRGHVFRTRCDTEVLVHLYEEYGEGMFERLNGQFAFALVDLRERRLYLARDRVGICPLHWTRRGDWFLFGSEIKALLASGLVPAACDPRGLDHVFTFFAQPARRTMFAGVQAILPGHFLRVDLGSGGRPAEIRERRYWDFDFPDAGSEEDPADPRRLVDEYEATFARAVELRLRADVPVVGYLSGGVDSAMVLATASRLRGEPLPSFTVRVTKPRFDELHEAAEVALAIGAPQTVLHCDRDVIRQAYPRLVAAAECPVIDTSCAALWCLSREVRDQGFKVVLTGEGSDETQAGYWWFKSDALMRCLDVGPVRPSVPFSRVLRKVAARHVPWAEQRRIDAIWGGPHAQSEMYNFIAGSRHRFYAADFRAGLVGRAAYEDLAESLDLDRMRRWHPLNRSLYISFKAMLPGMLLSHKGDRVAMANGVEARYPFLDDDVLALCNRLHPRWKLRGLFGDKHLLRQAALKRLPRPIALRRKAMFMAPMAESFLTAAPEYVRQLLSEESLRRTGYFDVAAVRRHFARYAAPRPPRLRHFVEMGLVSVVATQLWHHLHLGGGLCELPAAGPAPRIERPAPARAGAAG